MRFDWNEWGGVESKSIVSTYTPSECSSTSGSIASDTENYFIKHTRISGYRSLVLVQFQYQMVIFLLAGICLGYITSTTDAALTLGTRNELVVGGVATFKDLMYSFDIIYFLDFIAMVVYKHNTTERSNIRYKPRHGLALFIDFVSIVPFETIYSAVIKDSKIYVYYCLRLRYALRGHRLYNFIVGIKEYMHAALTLGCISYVVECRIGKLNCENVGTRKHTIMLHIYYSACRLFMLGRIEDITSRIMENFIASWIPYITTIYFISNFIVGVLQTSHGRFSHTQLFTWLNSKIAQWKSKREREWTGYNKKYELLTKQFKNIVWMKNNGIYASQYLGTILPPIMYKELALDVSWVPLKHTHLFRHEDVFFLRAVSAVMIHKTYYPGEIIFKRDQFKNMMIYVKMGIVQILSEEDGETPIVSLTSGTCLGESTLTISYESSCTVIAKDLCDVAIRDRYEEAISFRTLSLYQLEKDNCTDRIGVLTMKWLKLILRKLLFAQERFSDFRQKYFLQNLEQNIFCVKYLDFLVTAEDVQLITDSVFLRNKFPFVFKPNSALLRSWNILVAALALFAAVSFPYYTVFIDETSLVFYVIYNMITFTWVVDLYLKTSTAIETENSYIISFNEIIFHNLSASIWYTVDIISVIPTELMVTAIQASSCMLKESNEQRKFEFLNNLSVTMECFNLTQQLSKRIKKYADLQLQVHGIYFLEGTHILDTLPPDLAAMTYGIQIGDLIRCQNLFFELNEKILTHVCHIASIHLLPATETIKDMGEVCKEIHILSDGICTMTSFDGHKKKVYPGECFSVLESALNIPSMVTVKALSTCRIVSINFVKLNAIMLRYPDEYRILQNTIETFEDLAILAKIPSNYFISETEEIEEPSRPNIVSFGYNLKRRTKKYYRYHENFPKWSYGLKYLLLRYVFSNNGKFVFYWEISRSIFALLTNFILPFGVLHKNDRTAYVLDQAILCLDITAYIDIYIRLHFTYFNDHGIEVSHPYHTSKYQCQHSLMIDVLACFPFQKIAGLFGAEELKVLFSLNRILQLYRYIGLYQRIFGNKMRNKGVITMLAIVPHVIIAHNYITSFSFIAFCSLTGDSPTCKEDTWIGHVVSTQRLNPYGAYTIALMFITAGTTANSFESVRATTSDTLVWLLLLTLGSTIMYLVFIGNIVAISLSINKDLNTYQEAMKSLVIFLRYQKIDKNIKKEIVNHFEYMWHITRGKSIHKSFQPFKYSFKVEALYNFYGTPFKQSTIFPEPNSSFFKSLLPDIQHEIYLKTAIIYSVNDVHGYIFLLFKGTVEVVGADLNKLVSLRVGSVFGNLDNCPIGRRTLSMVALGHVEVLKFSSTMFHTQLKKFPELRKHFMKLTVFNVDFLEEKRILRDADKRTVFEVGKPVETRKKKKRSSSQALKNIHRNTFKTFSQNKVSRFYENVFLNIIYLGDYFINLYGIASHPSMIFKLFMYLFDLLHICKMCIRFNTTYEDESGHVITARKQIARTYIKQKLGFYVDLAGAIPIEVISLIFWYSESLDLIWSICRCNRLLRIIFPLVYLKRQTQKLNIKVFTTNCLYLLTKIFLATLTLGFWTRLMYNKELVGDGDLLRLDAYSKSMMIVSNAYWRFPYIVGYLQNRIEFLMVTRYMSNEKVSSPLMKRIILYAEMLWTCKKGNLFPHLLTEAPYYLKEAVLNSMFGFHLSLHPLLQHCHKDLTRQMASYMRTLVFFPGDIIAYVGDIDGCMYFIHEGEIHVLNEDTLHSERVETVLYTDEMFGLDQGLYEKCGHEFTYKAVKYSVIISLHRDDWIHLLEFFPASKSVIYDKTVAIHPDST
ncbi:hypothetical protein Trydic_g13688 [Trypoxylus dichotomus]